MANDEHVALLKQGVAAWNAWRVENPDISEVGEAKLITPYLHENPDIGPVPRGVGEAKFIPLCYRHENPDIDPAKLITPFLLTTTDVSPIFSRYHMKRVGGGTLGLKTPRQSGQAIVPKFRTASLAEANLHGADLKQANLTRADLKQANLRDADLSEADLRRADLREANLSGANFNWADLRWATLAGANLTHTRLPSANLEEADLCRAHLMRAYLQEANLIDANLHGANLSEACLIMADLQGADLSGADLRGANLIDADLSGADLKRADLSRAYLSGADLSRANLSGASLAGADLEAATLIDTDLTGADLTGCRIHGVSAWRLKLNEETKQQNLVITDADEPTVTVDNIEVAQFIYLLLHNEKIRDVIDTIGKKAVLILGRFTDERKAVLDALRGELRKRDYLPILFDFDVPATRDITETVSLLARMARFIIADLTDPSSIPKELEAIVPHLAVPVQPLLEGASRPYAMFKDYWKYDWVLPVYRYEGLEPLLATLADKVIAPAEGKVNALQERRRVIEAELTKPQ